MPDPLTVLLGPHIDLHPGIHGSLAGSGPEQVSYHQRGAFHHFLFPREGQVIEPMAPWRHPHLGEMVDFGPGPQVVHTARWPVLRRRAWVTDMDDFGYPLLMGRFIFHPVHDDRGGLLWDRGQVERSRLRCTTMLKAYAHPSCRGILFRTRHALWEAERWIESLGVEELGRQFLSKARVLYPAEQPILPGLFKRKWRDLSQVEVLFVGNDFAAKNGAVALAVLRRAARRFPRARFTYVGQIPKSFEGFTDGVHCLGTVPRSQVMDLMRRSHILFHPTLNESFGMVLVEAAANGMAVLTAAGPGMDHVHELLGEDCARFVDRRRVGSEEEEQAFFEQLEEMLEDPAGSGRLAVAAYASVAEGKLSLVQRNRQLAELYLEAQSGAGDHGLELAELIQDAEISVLKLSSREVSRCQRGFFSEEGIQVSSFYRGNLQRQEAAVA